MTGEYWAIVMGLGILVILTVGLGANLIFGAIKKRRAKQQTPEP